MKNSERKRKFRIPFLQMMIVMMTCCFTDAAVVVVDDVCSKDFFAFQQNFYFACVSAREREIKRARHSERERKR